MRQAAVTTEESGGVVSVAARTVCAALRVSSGTSMLAFLASLVMIEARCAADTCGGEQAAAGWRRRRRLLRCRGSGGPS